MTDIVEGQGVPEQVQPQVPEQTEEKPKGKDYQARISELTRFRREAERQTSTLEQENTQLTDQLVALSQKVDDLSRQTPRPEGKPSFDALFSKSDSSPAPAQPQVNSDEFDKRIETAMAKVIEPFARAQREEVESQQLFEQQQLSFNDAAKNLPKVASQDSDEQDLFNELWKAFPALQQTPDGPAAVIQMVRGILAPNSVGASIEEKKVAASTPPPGAPMSRLAELPTNQSKQEALLKDLIAKGKQGQLPRDEAEAYMKLRLMGIQPPKA